MRVVWATSNVPDPGLGGGAAFEHSLLSLAVADHRVRLVLGGLAPDRPIPPALAALDLDDVVVAWAPRRSVPSRPAMLARGLFGPPLEFWLQGPKVAAMNRQVERLDADLVHVMWAESAPVAIASARHRPTAFVATDSFTRHEQRALALAHTRRQRLFHHLQLRRVRRWERAYRQVGAVASVSPLDAAALADLGVSASVIPNTLDDAWFATPTKGRDPERVSFIAALDYGPNVDAAVWLIEDIWPRIRARRPSSELHVVGRNPSAALRARVLEAGGVLHADVDDVRPHYWRSGVVLSPVRLGAGARNKVLHAMACGAPLVSTTAGCEGLGLVHGEHLLIADDPDDLARAAVAVLDDPDAARRRAARAAAVAAQHGSAASAQALDELWRRAQRGARS